MSELLPGFEPSEADLVAMALAQPLDVKVRRAVAFIQSFEERALRLDPRGVRVADSFGKDSCVIKRLCEMAGIEHHLVHCLTTMDAPELLQFGRLYHPETELRKPAMPMVQMMIAEGKLPPTRMVSWCCDHYKHNHVVDFDKIQALGIRVSESKKRASFWKQVRPNGRGFMGAKINPILYWTDSDVWQFIRDNKVPYCELYDQGCKRLGCIGCPKNGQARIEEFKRWPKYEKRWHDAIVKTWERWKDVPRIKDGEPRAWAKWKSGDAAWQWWLENADDGDGDCMQQEMDMNV